MTDREIDSVDQFIRMISLRTVKVYEVSSRRRDGFDFGDPPKAAGGVELHLRANIADGRLLFRCRAELDTKDAALKADVGAVFSIPESVAILNNDVMDEFAKNAGLPIVLPYLRSELQQAARRIGVPAPILPHYWPGNTDAFLMPARSTDHQEAADYAM